MSAHADRLLKRARTFRHLTGLTPAAFATLSKEVAAADAKARARRDSRPGRARAAGAGRRHARPLADRLLRLLVSSRTDTPHALLAFRFGVDGATVSRHIRHLEPLLAGVFRIPERRVELSADEVRELLVDATERATQRPGPGTGRRRCDSGKKKRHTPKHQAAAAGVRKPDGAAAAPQRLRIAAVSKAVPGSARDRRLSDRSGVRLPAGVAALGDAACLGTALGVPRRKPRGRPRPAEQRRANRERSRRRVAAGHAIGKRKIWKIAPQRYRDPRRRHTLLFKNVAGPHNRMLAA